jgi:hypothetical protein
MQSTPDLTDTLAPLAYSVSEACKVSSIGRTYLYQLIDVLP